MEFDQNETTINEIIMNYLTIINEIFINNN